MATIDQVQPQRLYRYRSLDKFDRELKAIQQNYLFCAAYTSLNDPMEGVFRSSKVFRGSNDYRDARRAIVDNKTQIGMCSFREIHDHELMWAHYADQYRGICIGYSFAKFLDHLDDEVSFVQMYYNEAVPVVRHSRQEAADAAKLVLSYRNFRWLYEREWRMFSGQGRVDYGTKSCVTHVYLGSRIDPDKRWKMIRALKLLKIPTDDMKLDRYSITFKRASL